ncbi:protein of unknown function (plasmid) [Pseudorhizobium banfieldiae]|uniref:Uncharacterized protein n=1 Tax=Pseudorhizobium banfieldiae TaxID=1125847 RepID=L0NMJ3_9HYPH|nr:protein of unknown function [Pseudorhizobium banfieldiae]
MIPADHGPVDLDQDREDPNGDHTPHHHLADDVGRLGVVYFHQVGVLITVLHDTLAITVVPITLPLFNLFTLQLLETRNVLLRGISPSGLAAPLGRFPVSVYTILLPLSSVHRLSELVSLTLRLPNRTFLFQIHPEIALAIVGSILKFRLLV